MEMTKELIHLVGYKPELFELKNTLAELKLRKKEIKSFGITEEELENTIISRGIKELEKILKEN